MKIGTAANIGAYGAGLPRIARALEDLGFESVWAGEHIIVPVDIADPVRHGVPLPEMYRYMPDLFVTLAAVAAATTTIRLGTNVCLVTQRHPLVLAKEIATLDVLSNGRFILGAGTGWIEEESDIFGVPFKRRVAVANEYLRAMKTIWTQDEPAFQGEFVSFPPVHSNPKPVQKPYPPVVIGAGNANTDNSRVLKRVAETADGWLPINLSPAQLREQLGQLRELCAAAGRDFSRMDISNIVLSNSFGVDEQSWSSGSADKVRIAEMVAEYEDAGAGRLVVLPWAANGTELPTGEQWRFLSESFGLAG